MGRRKRTEQEKNNKKQQKVDDFSVDKDTMLSTFSELSETTLSQEVIDKFEIKPVQRLQNLRGKKLKQFNEPNYEKSLKEAYLWMSSNNDKKLDKQNQEFGKEVVELIDYYPQRFKGKSVIVSYNTVLEKFQ
jgi:hypothetical protein